MDFTPDASLEDFRHMVRSYLRDHLPAELAGKPVPVLSARDDIVQWQRLLHAQGWGAPSWSREHGGTGWTVLQCLAFDEECAAAGAPTQDTFGQRLLGPVLNAFGTPAQREEHIGPILRGERLWCQGFSEPGAGSDLASLRTRAVLEGDHYVVNGQKIWTSYAHQSDWIFMLVRTSTESKQQAGITFLLADLKTPGISTRPIVSIDGEHHLNEVFLDDVRVPVSNRVGEEGAGWAVTKFLLNNEHATNADVPALHRYLRKLREIGSALQLADGAAPEHHAFLLRQAAFEAEVEAIGMMVARVATDEQRGDHGPAAIALSSMLKLRSTDLQQRLTEFLVESLGDHGAVAYDGIYRAGRAAELPHDALARAVGSEMFFRRAATIYGGSNEVQRGIVSKVLLRS